MREKLNFLFEVRSARYSGGDDRVRSTTGRALCTSGPESNEIPALGLYGGPYPTGSRVHIIADNVRIPCVGGTRKASTRGGKLGHGE
jgi:hypothetical protein